MKKTKTSKRLRAAHGSPYVWIVEIIHTVFEHKSWRPTVGCGLDKRDARKELADWKRRNPCDRFRLTRYTANRRLAERKP